MHESGWKPLWRAHPVAARTRPKAGSDGAMRFLGGGSCALSRIGQHPSQEDATRQQDRRNIAAAGTAAISPRGDAVWLEFMGPERWLLTRWQSGCAPEPAVQVASLASGFAAQRAAGLSIDAGGRIEIALVPDLPGDLHLVVVEQGRRSRGRDCRSAGRCGARATTSRSLAMTRNLLSRRPGAAWWRR